MVRRELYSEDTSLQSDFFAGLIDEVRMSNVVRTAQWISTEHSNQNSSATFYTVKCEEAATAPNWCAGWAYRKKITIENGQVDADLSDFPVYVDLANLGADFHANVSDANGGDIRVTAGDGVTELPRCKRLKKNSGCCTRFQHCSGHRHG